MEAMLETTDATATLTPSPEAQNAGADLPAPEEAAAGLSRKAWPAAQWLPLQLSVALPVPQFRVRDLIALHPGQTIATKWPNGDDLPLSIEDVQLAWIEMEAVDQDMAVRITRLL